MVFGILVVRNSVVRHYRRSGFGLSMELKGTFNKRFLVHLEVFTWVYSIFTIGEVRITTALTSASTREMFAHSIDTLVTPSVLDFSLPCRGLETIYIGTCHIGSQFWRFSKSEDHTIPARFRTQVYLRGKSCGNTHSTVFLGSDFTKLLYDRRIKGGGHGQSIRPKGDISSCSCIVFCSYQGGMAWVGRDIYWNSQR